MRTRALVAALGVGMVILTGALVIGLTASTGSFTLGTAAIVAVYLLWPGLLLLVGVLLAISFTLFAAAFFARIRRRAR